MGWFAGGTCKNHNKWYTQPPKLLCNVYNEHDLHTWTQTACLIPMAYRDWGKSRRPSIRVLGAQVEIRQGHLPNTNTSTWAASLGDCVLVSSNIQYTYMNNHWKGCITWQGRYIPTRTVCLIEWICCTGQPYSELNRYRPTRRDGWSLFLFPYICPRKKTQCIMIIH
jgi:hypothetical protein